MSDREDAHQIHRSTVDSPVVADGTREGDIDDLPVAQTDHHLGQQHLDLEARVHVGHERVVEGGVHAEALEYLARVRLGLPAAELRELLLQLRGADAVLVREVGLFVEAPPA